MSTVPPQDRPRSPAISAFRWWVRISGPWPVAACAAARTSASTHPPPTDPSSPPAGPTSIFVPTGTGVDPSVRATVASAPPLPARASSAAARQMVTAREAPRVALPRAANGYHDRPPDDQRYGEGVVQLGVVHALLAAAHEVVGDAVIAAQHHRGHEAEQLFGLDGERARFVGAGVEGEEPVDVEISGLEDGRVHLLAKVPEGLQRLRGVAHAETISSRSGIRPGST